MQYPDHQTATIHLHHGGNAAAIIIIIIVKYQKVLVYPQEYPSSPLHSSLQKGTPLSTECVTRISLSLSLSRLLQKQQI